MLASKKIKDLTTAEFKALIKETVSEAIDPEALKESIEIASDRGLVKQLKSSRKAYNMHPSPNQAANL